MHLSGEHLQPGCMVTGWTLEPQLETGQPHSYGDPALNLTVTNEG